MIDKQITEDYVSAKTASLLKDRGFNIPCKRIYNHAIYGEESIATFTETCNDFLEGNVCTAPTISVACKWLRYTHSLPTLDREVAYDIYATYLDYTENVKNFGYDPMNSDKLQKYEKYIKKKFQNSKLLNKILSVLQTADKNRLLYLTGDVDNTVSIIKSLIQ